MKYINILLMLGIVALHGHGEDCPNSQELKDLQGTISYKGVISDAKCKWILPDIGSQGLIIHLINMSLEIIQRNRTIALGNVILPGNVTLSSTSKGSWFAYSSPGPPCELKQLAEKVDTSSPDGFTWKPLVDKAVNVIFQSQDSSNKSFHLNYTYVNCKDITASSNRTPQQGGMKQIAFIVAIAVLTLIVIILTAICVHQRVTTKQEKTTQDCQVVYALAANDSDGASSNRHQEPLSEATSHSYINPYEEIPAHVLPENYSEVVPNSLYNGT